MVQKIEPVEVLKILRQKYPDKYLTFYRYKGGQITGLSIRERVKKSPDTSSAIKGGGSTTQIINNTTTTPQSPNTSSSPDTSLYLSDSPSLVPIKRESSALSSTTPSISSSTRSSSSTPPPVDNSDIIPSKITHINKPANTGPTLGQQVTDGAIGLVKSLGQIANAAINTGINVAGDAIGNIAVTGANTIEKIKNRPKIKRQKEDSFSDLQSTDEFPAPVPYSRRMLVENQPTSYTVTEPPQPIARAGSVPYFKQPQALYPPPDNGPQDRRIVVQAPIQTKYDYNNTPRSNRFLDVLGRAVNAVKPRPKPIMIEENLDALQDHPFVMPDNNETRIDRPTFLARNKEFDSSATTEPENDSAPLPNDNYPRSIETKNLLRDLKINAHAYDLAGQRMLDDYFKQLDTAVDDASLFEIRNWLHDQALKNLSINASVNHVPQYALQYVYNNLQQNTNHDLMPYFMAYRWITSPNKNQARISLNQAISRMKAATPYDKIQIFKEYMNNRTYGRQKINKYWTHLMLDSI